MIKDRKIAFREAVNKFTSTTYATFGLYRYPAKFIPQVIAYVLENYAQPRMKVFDPFAGYGTVGIVSRIYDCDYELWDLNPILETLHKIAILEPKKVDVKAILKRIAYSNEKFVPDWSNLDYWFPEEFLPFLFKMWGFYHSLEDEYMKLIVTIPLLKTARYFSFDDIQRQKLSKSPVSKKRVASLLSSNWETQFFDMLGREIEKVIKGINEYSTLLPKHVKPIVRGGIDTCTTDLEEEKDLLITSPPYLQSQEYIRQAKMDLFWLGKKEDEIKKLGKLEIPYRDIEPQSIFSETFSKMRNKIKQDNLQIMFDRYFWGVLGALTRLQEKIRNNMFLFVGHSSVRGRQIPLDRIFSEHFEKLGWVHESTLVDTIVARRLFTYRRNPATKIEDRRTLTENLVVLRRK